MTNHLICILCSSTKKITREHRFPKKLLDEFTGKTDEKGFFKGSTKIAFSNSKTAKILRPKKNICQQCNNSFGQSADLEFYNLIMGVRDYSKNAPSNTGFPSNEVVLSWLQKRYGIKENYSLLEYVSTLGDGIDLREILISKSVFNEIEIKRFISKFTACYAHRSGLPIPEVCKEVFCKKTDSSKIEYILGYNNDAPSLGCVATSLKHFNNHEGEYLFFRLIFGNIYTQIKVFF